MTTFNRRGHFRRGPKGQQVWVEGHTVTRSSGQQYTYGFPTSTPSYASPPPRVVAPTTRFPWSARWMRPNAACPVCGASVYFYSNEFGSRVYFDEVGPPWPKHPCTVSVHIRGAAGVSDGRGVAPVIYPVAVRRRMLAKGEFRPLADSALHASYEAFVVEGARQTERGTLIDLKRLYEKSALKEWETSARVSLEPGQVVFMQDGWLSYLDARQINVVRFPVHPIRKESFFDRLRAKFDR
jgi:hypothetical protein